MAKPNQVLQSGTITPGHTAVWVTDGVIADSFAAAPSPSIPTVPIGQGGLVVYVAQPFATTSANASHQEFGLSVNFTNNTGAAASVPVSSNRVGGYFAIQTLPTCGNSWASN